MRALVFALLIVGGCGFAAPCTLQSCSNDPEILGDAYLSWDPPVGGADVVWYDVVETRDILTCATVQSDVSSFRIDGSPCLAGNNGALLSVRACNANGCSALADPPVEFWSWLCIEGGREVRCFPDAPCRLPANRGCL
jgi:hypothetical protein